MYLRILFDSHPQPRTVQTAPELLTELEAQLHETQSSLATPVDKGTRGSRKRVYEARCHQRRSQHVVLRSWCYSESGGGRGG